MKVSIVIPCRNAASTISTQLEALAKQEWSQPWEVIISDNNSTDELFAVVEQYKDRIYNLRVVNASEQRGAAHARNVGARVANGELLIFIDADDEVAPGWLAAMGEALSKYDFVTGRKDCKKLNEAWVRKCYGTGEEEGIHENSYLPFAAGNNLGIKRELHNAIAGFDETLLTIEDVDYCWRVQQLGTKLHYVPEALLHFRLRNTLKGMYRRAWDIGVQEALLYKKHRPMGAPQLLPWKLFVKSAVELPLQLLQVHDKETLGKWLMHFAWRGGQFIGCIQHRYLPI